MNSRKPYLLFHGYKRFEKRFKPNLNHPLWTGELEAASDYIGENADGGLLVLEIDVQKLKMVDINDEVMMKKIFGDVGDLIAMNQSFYYFLEDLYYYGDLDDGWLDGEKLKKKFGFQNIDWIVNACNAIARKYSADELESYDFVTNKLFVPKIYKAGFNCVVEHEENLMNYVLLTDEMLNGECCLYLDAAKYPEGMFDDMLSELLKVDIYKADAMKDVQVIVASFDQISNQAI